MSLLKNRALALCFCLLSFFSVAIAGTQSYAGKAQQKDDITITPGPVLVGLPWQVVVTGLRPGEDNIVLGNGYDDGNWMYHAFFTADSSGQIKVSPPVFQVVVMADGTVMNPVGQHQFQVLKMLKGGTSQVLGSQWYQ